MQTMRTATSLLLLGAAVLFRWQDPYPAPQQPASQQPAPQQPASQQPAPQQPGSQPPPAVQQPADPATDTLEKPAAVIPGKPERSALEGVYRLRSRVTNGIADAKPSRGYLAITSRHLFLNLASPGPDEEYALLHSGVREWQKVGEDIRTTAKLEYFTDDDGEIFHTPAGKQEMRRMVIVRGGVRVMQDAHSWLEFERVE